MTIEIERNLDAMEARREVFSATESTSVHTKSVNLRQGYSLSGMNEVRNLATGETMTIYEAKIKGVATDVRESKSTVDSKQQQQQVRILVEDAVDRGLVNFSVGSFTNPATGQSIPIVDAVKLGMLITDLRQEEEIVRYDVEAPTIPLATALRHCFDEKKRKFNRQGTKESLTLEQAVETDWINGNDVIFDVGSAKKSTLKEAMQEGVINGKTCEYTVLATKEKHFILDAAKSGLVAVFPEPKVDLELSEVTYSLQETFENGVYHRATDTFTEAASQREINVLQALKIGLVDFRSAEVKNTSTGATFNLLDAVEAGVISSKTGKVRDVKAKKEMTLIDAYEDNLVAMVERGGSPFECITLWEAIERKQLDTETGMFYSVHEENKKMTLEEAVYRKYIDKKSAFVKDTWKRKYCSLSEASRKKIMLDGRVMNTTTGRYLTVAEAVEQEILVREIRAVSLVEALDFGMYHPHSGAFLLPGMEREVTLREAVEFQLIDHTRTVVRTMTGSSSGRYVATLEAMRSGELDGNAGTLCGMNLLEARSRGFLLAAEAMVNDGEDDDGGDSVAVGVIGGETEEVEEVAQHEGEGGGEAGDEYEVEFPDSASSSPVPPEPNNEPGASSDLAADASPQSSSSSTSTTTSLSSTSALNDRLLKALLPIARQVQQLTLLHLLMPMRGSFFCVADQIVPWKEPKLL